MLLYKIECCVQPRGERRRGLPVRVDPRAEHEQVFRVRGLRVGLHPVHDDALYGDKRHQEQPEQHAPHDRQHAECLVPVPQAQHEPFARAAHGQREEKHPAEPRRRPRQLDRAAHGEYRR